MAEHAQHSTASNADLTHHQRTWKGFLTLIKWSLVAILLVMASLAIFRVH